jgi:hypothetical protein
MGGHSAPSPPPDHSVEIAKLQQQEQNERLQAQLQAQREQQQFLLQQQIAQRNAAEQAQARAMQTAQATTAEQQAQRAGLTAEQQLAAQGEMQKARDAAALAAFNRPYAAPAGGGYDVNAAMQAQQSQLETLYPNLPQNLANVPQNQPTPTANQFSLPTGASRVQIGGY